jgi:3',5'-cyclic AMP phosphodiesterase CpdA
MRTVAHISDAHFGAHDPVIAGELADELNYGDYDVVAISGDITQRGRVDQFQAARQWLDSLTVPYLVVPGNHDVPMFDVITRFFRPRDRYVKYMTPDLAPCFVDDEIAMCGIDTTKRFTIKHGHVTHEQVAHAAETLAWVAPRWRIIVAHHPFIVPQGFESERVDGAIAALPILEDAGVDVILSGHLHTQSVAGRNEHHTIVAAQAGTCMSTRLRGEPQCFNQIQFDGDTMTIINRVWDGGRFADGALKSYRRNGVFAPEHLVKVAERRTPPELPHH